MSILWEQQTLVRYTGSEHHVVIPEGTTAIGKHAFRGCWQLGSVVIPSSVTQIGEGAFENCRFLRKLVLADGVVAIGKNAFRRCTCLEEVLLPESIEHIGDYAFRDCTQLRRVQFANPVSIADTWMAHYRWDEDGYEHVTRVGKGVFKGCGQLKAFTIEQRDYPLVCKDHKYVFEWAASEAIGDRGTFVIEDGVLVKVKPSWMQSVIVVPDGVTKIADWVFAYRELRDSDPYFARDLRCVVLPEGLTEIGKGAFSGCRTLQEIVLPKSLKTIGAWAFFNCRRLSVKIPRSVTSIGEHAFFHNSCLTSVCLPDALTVIDEGSFKSCQRLARVTLPEGLTKIRKDAFADCESLTHIDFPEGLTSIGKEAFSETALRSLHIPASLTHLYFDDFYGIGVFGDCREIRRITVDEGNPEYDSRDNCNALIRTSLDQIVLGCRNTHIPASVKGIGPFAFLRVVGLTHIAIPDNVTSIGSFAFRSCEDLRYVTVGRGVTQLGRNSFAYCTFLRRIDLPEGLKSIGMRCFEGCWALESIHLPDSVTTIGDFAFLGCLSLREITGGAGLEEVRYAAFDECSRLEGSPFLARFEKLPWRKDFGGHYVRDR